MTSAIADLTLILLKKEKLTKDTYTFYFSKPKGFIYEPGQYLKLKLDIENPDLRGLSRYFTISSAPQENNLAITTRIIKSSFKKRLASLSEKSKIRARGPYGSFILDKNKKNVAMISSGLGITPFRSMITQFQKESGRKIKLLAFFEDGQNFVFERELGEIVRKNNEIQVLFQERTQWKTHVSAIVKKNIENISESVYYIAGAERFVREAKSILKKAGVSEEEIVSEDFVGYSI